MAKEYTAIGLMSGTSLDGLDICYAAFSPREDSGRWDFRIGAAETRSYPPELQQKLGVEVQRMSAREFAAFHSEYGDFLGREVNRFISRTGLRPQIVASHGHTVFHEPSRRLMYQIGDGAAIAARTRIPTVSDFRRLDIMLGGQGAPLVPAGDRLLFGDYDFVMNIGGFSNISYEKEGRRIAFDISPVNYVLNHYCRKAGLAFDEGGGLASRGRLSQPLLSRLGGLPYYAAPPPKSLGREWVETYVFPLIDGAGLPLEDILRTFCEHAAAETARVTAPGKTLFLTGGGAFNTFLVDRIRTRTGCEVILPDRQTIEFKEALIFAFLGVLYMADIPSCLRSVTGAACDSIGGSLFKMPASG